MAAVFLAFREYLPGRLVFETGLVFATPISTGFAVAFYTGQRGLALAGSLGSSSRPTGRTGSG